MIAEQHLESSACRTDDISTFFTFVSCENVSPVRHTLRLMHERCWGVRKVGIRADNVAPLCYCAPNSRVVVTPLNRYGAEFLSQQTHFRFGGGIIQPTLC